MKLKEFIRVKTGYIRSRIKEGDSKIAVYSKSHFDLDKLYCTDKKLLITDFIMLDIEKYDLTKENNIIIDSLTKQAAIISEENKEMFYAFNYFVAEPIHEKIDANFFVAWFNLSDECENQLNSLLQGTTLKKLNLSQLENLQITLPPLDKQKEIGELYKKSLLRYNLSLKIKENEMDIIKNILAGEINE